VIQVFRRGEFDVAILDLKMEGIDGIEVVKIFKKMDMGMPVTMLTIHSSEQAAHDGIAFGACS
jgi:DNA-binding response OmpR family regulator